MNDLETLRKCESKEVKIQAAVFDDNYEEDQEALYEEDDELVSHYDAFNQLFTKVSSY